MNEARQLQRLAALYRGLSRAHGIYELLQRKSGGKKVEGKARTVRAEVKEDLWLAHLKGEQGLGIVPINDENQCYFGAIDIDRYDLDLAEVEQRVAMLQLPLLPTRTKSGGVHLYCFGREALGAALLKQRLEEWSVALGFGGAEVFPKQSVLLNDRDVGNWINMPYFAAFTGKTERYGVFTGKPLDLPAFIERAEKLRLTEKQLEALTAPEEEDFASGPPCLQSLSRTGFPQGMRNDGLAAVAVYLKRRYPDDWPMHLLAYNTKYMKPPLGEGEVKQLQKSMARKDYNYSCNKAPIKNFCNRSLCRTREFGVGSGDGEWNVVIDSDVQKILTEPPYFIVTVNGVRMQFFSEELLSQRTFQKMCMDRVNLKPSSLSATRWDAELNRVMANAQLIEAPSDSGAGGELEYYLEQFCTVHAQAETRAELLRGLPYTEEGWTYFRSADFKRYLEAQHFRALSGPRLYARLRQIGVAHKQFWVEEQNIMVWAVKAFERKMPTIDTRTVDKGGM